MNILKLKIRKYALIQVNTQYAHRAHTHTLTSYGMQNTNVKCIGRFCQKCSFVMPFNWPLTELSLSSAMSIRRLLLHSSIFLIEWFSVISVFAHIYPVLCVHFEPFNDHLHFIHLFRVARFGHDRIIHCLVVSSFFFRLLATAKQKAIFFLFIYLSQSWNAIQIFVFRMKYSFFFSFLLVRMWNCA